MNYNMLRLVLKLLLIFILVAFFNSGVLAAGSFPFKWSKDQEPEQHQAKQKQMKEGPPSHASAHGFYRAKHKYHIILSKRSIMILREVFTFT